MWPFTYQANVTIQREIGRGMSASASYVGAFARNLAAPVDRNYPVMASGPRPSPTSMRAGPTSPATIAAANVLESIFTSDYNALQLSAERRGAELSFKGNYTFGRALEDVDFQGGGLPTVQNCHSARSGARALIVRPAAHLRALDGLEAELLRAVDRRAADPPGWLDRLDDRDRAERHSA